MLKDSARVSQRNFFHSSADGTGGGGAGTATGAFTNIRTGEGAQGQRRIPVLRMVPPPQITFGDHMVLLWHKVVVPGRLAA